MRRLTNLSLSLAETRWLTVRVSMPLQRCVFAWCPSRLGIREPSALPTKTTNLRYLLSTIRVLDYSPIGHAAPAEVVFGSISSIDHATPIEIDLELIIHFACHIFVEVLLVTSTRSILTYSGVEAYAAFS